MIRLIPAAAATAVGTGVAAMAWWRGLTATQQQAADEAAWGHARHLLAAAAERYAPLGAVLRRLP